MSRPNRPSKIHGLLHFGAAVWRALSDSQVLPGVHTSGCLACALRHNDKMKGGSLLSSSALLRHRVRRPPGQNPWVPTKRKIVLLEAKPSENNTSSWKPNQAKRIVLLEAKPSEKNGCSWVPTKRKNVPLEAKPSEKMSALGRVTFIPPRYAAMRVDEAEQIDGSAARLFTHLVGTPIRPELKVFGLNDGTA